ncbi:hypothetical protein I6U33_25900 [Pseudomonas carnis]|uniref:hypothetical protein n=1 Tax=Pseudomonas carnis TaxID=2487355 RepID=UPI001C6F7F79|nr:hypothetical protein [Pseudomonas carnis]MBW9240768.1 hypothetical protein [Pseudomonas carnis]
MNRLIAGLLLGLIGGVPAGAAIYALYVTHEQAKLTYDRPVASFEKPCLKLTKGAVNTFKSGEIERSDFCTLDGEPIKWVFVNDEGSWDFSRPWHDSDKVIQHRLAFSRKKPSTSKTLFQIYTATKFYDFVIPADRI